MTQHLGWFLVPTQTLHLILELLDQCATLTTLISDVGLQLLSQNIVDLILQCTNFTLRDNLVYTYRLRWEIH